MRKPDPVAPDAPVAAPADRFTLDGDAAVEARVAADQAVIAQAVAGLVPAQHFAALVLMGGYGRGEGGYVQGEQGPAPFNDYDYFVVVRGMGRGARAALALGLAALAETLAGQVGVAVDFALLRQETLARAEFSLMNAEMQWGHRVLAGERDVLARMPHMPFHALPHGELTRLMLNRGTLLLMNQQRLLERRSGGAASGAETGLDPGERQRFFKYLMKAVRACGDTRLAAAGLYHPSYAEKLARLEAPRPERTVDAAEGLDPMPHHDDFLELYRLAHRHKFHPAYEEFAGEQAAEWLARVLRIWKATLYAFEIRRLGFGFAHWHDYCRADVRKGQRGNLVRNVGVTVRDFGARELLRRPRRSLYYPRERLIAALPLLLTEPGSPIDPCAASALGLPSPSHWQPASERYLGLWAKYA
ncbi:hypothetical protein [Thiohalocapsa sp. ML1]|jgi:hypothetical protein|uniref:hypothetical protein n=1 Tax=Thiohalocapsa sp. ML1 TaxID=1431688 RepID=UPI0007320F5E|nr:hypothetical protein [Thiohalocapsa sp. ML1]